MYLLLKRNFTGLFLLLVFSTNSQIMDQTKWWSLSQKQTSDSEFVITMHCEIPKGWHTYSQYTDSIGPTPMAFTYTASPKYKLKGKTEEGSCISEYDSTYKCVVKYFVKPVDFKQKLVVHKQNEFVLKGNVYFQSCNNGQCLRPLEYDFSVNIPSTLSGHQTSN